MGDTITGLHHITVIAGDPQENLDFYVGVMGMRLVKTSKLGGFLPEWQGLRTLFACVDPKPVVGTAASYTVWVEDAATRLPVPATVNVGTSTVNANQRFTHVFKCGAPETETLDGVRGQPGRTITTPGVCDQIRITAPGYIPLSVRY